MKKAIRICAFFAVAALVPTILANAAEAKKEKTLRTDVFGNVYVGNSPFSVGKVDTHRAGDLRTDVFGNVYAGDSPFSLGKVNTTAAGVLHADAFGSVYAGDSPFSIGSTRREDEKYLPFLMSP